MSDPNSNPGQVSENQTPLRPDGAASFPRPQATSARAVLKGFVLRFIPKDSLLFRALSPAFYFFYQLFSLRFLRAALNYLVKRQGWFSDGYIPENFGYTILFTDQPGLFPDYPFRQTISGPKTRRPVSLICTGINEADTVEAWMECIAQQTRQPDEIVIVDGGSTDGTVAALQSLAAKYPVPLRILARQGLNIAQGRNLAIAESRNELIAATDFGCRPEKDWLESMAAPFERNPQVEAVSGWYVGQNRLGEAVERPAWPRLSQVDPGSFIPSSRSIAFSKDAWRKIGGYPEWLTLTGEDTYFALELNRFTQCRAFVPQAVVRWLAPQGMREYWKKVSAWSVGDGEAGLQGYLYWYTARQIILGGLAFCLELFLALVCLLAPDAGLKQGAAGLLLLSLAAFWLVSRKPGYSMRTVVVEFGAKIARLAGYMRGARRRKIVDLRRLEKTRGFYFILAGVPIYDTGGGSRGAQMALELLRQNYAVVYINRFDSYEPARLRVQIAHPNLMEVPLSKFSWDQFIRRYGALISQKNPRVLIEFPLQEFLPLLQQLKSARAVIAYDLLDDWDTQLGSAWYNRAIEEQIIQAAQVLIATAPVLAERLEALTGREVARLPNAVNLRLFNAQRAYLKPADFPDGRPVITYIGALWGEWFDWELLIAIAEAFPQAAVLVIGNYQGQCPRSLANLHFLGLKPQADLPAYLAGSDVAIIPWKENDITYATSPLKLYEYLAMRKPVVAPALPLLKGIPNVSLAGSRDEFVNLVRLGCQNAPAAGESDEFILLNSWEQRIKELIGLMEKTMEG